MDTQPVRRWIQPGVRIKLNLPCALARIRSR